jgi:hypothetical protein
MTTITTEEVERLAQTHDLVRFTLGMKAPEHDLTAAALRSLAAERDALRAELTAIVIPTTYYMDPPDGGDVSIAEQVSRMYRHVCDLEAENARLREVLHKARAKYVELNDKDAAETMAEIITEALGDVK